MKKLARAIHVSRDTIIRAVEEDLRMKYYARKRRNLLDERKKTSAKRKDPQGPKTPQVHQKRREGLR